MPDAALFHSRFAAAITAQPPPATMPPGFTVYRNTWLKGLLDALDANYPTVAMILGADLFEDVALQFARANPAQTPVLALYGAGFADFLARHALGREIPYLGDIAALERLWTESFFAPDAPIFDPLTCAGLEPAELLELRAKLHPATRMKRFQTPAVTIWLAHRADDGFQAIEPEWTAESALVTRHGMSVSVDLIDEPTHRLLTEVQRGQSLGHAIAEIAEAHPDCDLAAILTTVLSSGALAAPQPEDKTT